MSTRPTRTRKPPPLTYWEEYVETDAWYLKKLVEDVPEEEMQAALYDEDYTRGEDVMSGDEDEDDASCSEEDVDYELVEQEDIAISNGSDESDAEDSDSSSCGSDAESESEEEVYGSSEGECRSEAEDGESSCSSMGEGGPSSGAPRLSICSD